MVSVADSRRTLGALRHNRALPARMIAIGQGIATNAAHRILHRRISCTATNDHVNTKLQVFGGLGACSALVKSAATCSCEVGTNRFATKAEAGIIVHRSASTTCTSRSRRWLQRWPSSRTRCAAGEPVIGPQVDRRCGDGLPAVRQEAAVAHHSLNISIALENEGLVCRIFQLIRQLFDDHTMAQSKSAEALSSICAHRSRSPARHGRTCGS